MQSIASGTVIGTIRAVDEDIGNNGILFYSLQQLAPVSSNPSFIIQPITGDLSLSGTIDEDTDYRLRIIATVRSRCFLLMIIDSFVVVVVVVFIVTGYRNPPSQ